MFKADQNKTFSHREEEVLDFWQEHKVFEKSVENNKDQPYFSFYDGPPFATGLPHYGHLLAGTIKDVVLRFKTMEGFCVPRRFGWDCHGLPVENEIEKDKQIFGAKAIEKFGIAKFNDACREIVFRYTKEWKKTVERMGRWVDFSHTYRTMDKTFMESVWWVCKELFEKGLIYEGFKVMPFSAQLGTPLSNFEANLNYKEVDDPSIAVAFPVRNKPKTFFLAWTTTPWTLVSNLALAVNGEIDYVEIEELETQNCYILAKARLQHYFKDPKKIKILNIFKGDKLANLHYEPLFPYFEDHLNAFRILVDDFVSTEDGTGIVHMAPAFGEADFDVCKKANIEVVCPVDNNGYFTDEVGEYAGKYIKDADKEIIRHLKEKGLIYHHGQIRHRYPFCWRSDTPLIYKAVRTWFVSVEKIKDNLIKANEKIYWMPNHVKEGRFGKWLENARDWAISRNRYWGTPIPIWRNEEDELYVIGSIAELEKLTGKKITDLHRESIDDLTFTIDGKVYKRITEVFDCWFESGSMPYAQNHYPFENKEFTETTFPADFIAEGLDQTRGWFYTLNVLSTALFNKPAFKNVIVNGIILAEDGMKMSKRLKNYPEPDSVIHKYGADAIRLYMLHSPAVKAEDLRFSERGVELILRQILIPLWNSFYFLSTYAKIYHWTPKHLNKKPDQDIDRWILSLVQKLTGDVKEAMDQYDLSHAVDPFVTFIDQLTNWYIRRCRPRFWADEDSEDRRDAFSTLYQVLLTLSKITASFIPFISESIYQELKEENMPLSVHLCSYPKADSFLRDEELEKEMSFVQLAVSLGHALRKEYKMKVRQPLAAAHIVAADPETLKALKHKENLIKDELNVKEIYFSSEEGEFITKTIKPNFPVLGKKVGKLIPLIQKELNAFDTKQINRFEAEGFYTLEIADEKVMLSLEDVIIEKKVKEGLAAMQDKNIAIALETKLNDELIEEGLAREIVNKINTMRREKNLHVTDRINIVLDTSDVVQTCFKNYQDYIANEVLAINVLFNKVSDGTEWDLNGHNAKISISKTTLKD